MPAKSCVALENSRTEILFLLAQKGCRLGCLARELDAEGIAPRNHGLEADAVVFRHIVAGIHPLEAVPGQERTPAAGNLAAEAFHGGGPGVFSAPIRAAMLFCELKERLSFSNCSWKLPSSCFPSRMPVVNCAAWAIKSMRICPATEFPMLITFPRARFHLFANRLPGSLHVGFALRPFRRLFQKRHVLSRQFEDLAFVATNTGNDRPCGIIGSLVRPRLHLIERPPLLEAGQRHFGQQPVYVEAVAGCDGAAQEEGEPPSPVLGKFFRQAWRFSSVRPLCCRPAQ